MGTGIANTTANFYNGAQNRKNQLLLQQRQQEFQEYMATHGAEMQAQGMANAGINPVMAAGGSGTTAASGQMSTGMTGQGGINSNMAKMLIDN